MQSCSRAWRVLASFHGSNQEGVVVERIDETDVEPEKNQEYLRVP